MKGREQNTPSLSDDLFQMSIPLISSHSSLHPSSQASVVTFGTVEEQITVMNFMDMSALYSLISEIHLDHNNR